MNMNKIINWESEVSEPIYTRLAECQNIKSDIVPLTKVIKKVYNCDKKFALDYMLEWLTDWNNQLELYPSDKDYEKCLKALDK